MKTFLFIALMLTSCSLAAAQWRFSQMGCMMGFSNCCQTTGCMGHTADDCKNVPGCTLCRMDLGSSSQVSVCINEAMAQKMPSAMCTCGVDPTPDVRNDECNDLDKSHCEANDTCSWCVSAAVKSACYTVEQAKRLPSAVFQCKLPTY